MKQERLDEIKKWLKKEDAELCNVINASEGALFEWEQEAILQIGELISALEESQAELVESLIVQIFESGGDLRGMSTNGSKYLVFYKGDRGAERLKSFDLLIPALEFILERTRSSK